MNSGFVAIPKITHLGPIQGNATDDAYKSACKAMGREPINPIGYCYDSAGFYIAAEGHRLDARLCHGLGSANLSGQEGIKMSHAWVESDGMAFDCVWGCVMPIQQMRESLQVTFVVKYTRNEVLRLWKETNLPGPWHRKLIKAQKKIGKWP